MSCSLNGILSNVRIIEPTELLSRRRRRQFKPARLFFVSSLFVLSVCVIVLLIGYVAPLPAISGQAFNFQLGPQPVTIHWPDHGQAALAADGYGLLAQNRADKPVPIASVAKIMTALAVLKQKPLDLHQSGPNLTLTAADVALYQNNLSDGGSVVPVVNGETISEYQSLEAMLLPSANNMADTLVNWAFGSMDNYIGYANSLAQGLGLRNTHIADASGFADMTVSTAADLVVIGQQALKNPVLAQIVQEKSAIIPIAGEVINTNFILGQNGLIGIKTGNTDAAGGCFLLAIRRQWQGHLLTVIGAVLGAPTLDVAMHDGLSLADSAYTGFGSRKIVGQGQQVGYYSLPTGHRLQAVAKSQLNVFGWLGQPVTAQASLKKLHYPLRTGQAAGELISTHKSVPVVLAQSATAPSVGWRLKRLLN